MVHVDYYLLLKQITFRLLLASLLSAPEAIYAHGEEAYGAQNSVIPFRMIAGFAVVVPVTINGRGPYDFLLDTGATVTFVDRDLGGTLGLNLQGRGTVTSLGAKTPVAVAVARSLRVGPIVKADIEVMIRDLDGLHWADRSIRGVLGQNALDTADFLLDYEHRVVQFDLNGELLQSLEGPRRRLIRVPLANNHQYWNPAITAEVMENGSGAEMLLLDSGAESLVLFQDGAKATLGFSSNDIKDAGGNTHSSTTGMVRLCIYPACWNLMAHFVEFHDSSLAVRGLLPTSLFSRLYISNTGGFALTNPKQRRRSTRASTELWPGGRSLGGPISANGGPGLICFGAKGGT